MQGMNFTQLSQPLLFDLSRDPREASPLNTSDPYYAQILASMLSARDDVLADIASTPRSVAARFVLTSDRKQTVDFLTYSCYINRQTNKQTKTNK
jgi:hypothetical protein